MNFRIPKINRFFTLSTQPKVEANKEPTPTKPKQLDPVNIEFARKFLTKKMHKEQCEAEKKGIPLEKRSLKQILENARKSEDPIKSLQQDLIKLQDQSKGHRFILSRIKSEITLCKKEHSTEAKRIQPRARRLCRMERTLLLHESKYLAKQQKLYKSEKDYLRVKKWADELKTLTSTPPEPTAEMRLGNRDARKELAQEIQKLTGKRVITIPLEHIKNLEELISKSFISRLWEIRQSFPVNYYQDLKHMEKQLNATLKDFVENYKTLSVEKLSSLISKKLYRENSPNLNAYVQEVLNSNNFKQKVTLILNDMQEYL